MQSRLVQLQRTAPPQGDTPASRRTAPRPQVAEFPTSGLIFRDTVKIIELEDEKGAHLRAGVLRKGGTLKSTVLPPLLCRLNSPSVSALVPSFLEFSVWALRSGRRGHLPDRLPALDHGTPGQGPL